MNSWDIRRIATAMHKVAAWEISGEEPCHFSELPVAVRDVFEEMARDAVDMLTAPTANT